MALFLILIVFIVFIIYLNKYPNSKPAQFMKRNRLSFALRFIFSGKDSKFYFGAYPIDAEANFCVPISWHVIEKNFGRRLIISDNVIDAKPYNDSASAVNWQTCTLRKWLNEDFVEKAFSPKEQLRIEAVKVKGINNSNPDETKATIDKVFLLSKSEYDHYLYYSTRKSSIFTGYSEQKAEKIPLTNNGSGKTSAKPLVWFRSPGPDNVAWVTDSEGKNIQKKTYSSSGIRIEDNASYPVVTIAGVRPVMWISLF